MADCVCRRSGGCCRCGVPPGATWPFAALHVSRPPAAGHAGAVGRAAASGPGATVAAWPPPARSAPPWPGGLLQVSGGLVLILNRAVVCDVHCCTDRHLIMGWRRDVSPQAKDC